MKTRSLSQIVFDCQYGAPAQRLAKCQGVQIELQQEMMRLKDDARQQCADYRRHLEAWHSERVTGLPRPLALPQDVRDGRLFYTGAVVLSVVEVVLAFFIALGFGSNPLFFVLMALVAIFGVKAGLLLVWRNPSQPQQTKRRLLRYVIAPSLVITILAIGVLIFARTASGFLALALLGLLNWSVCLLSFGCLGLAAGFFAMSWLLFWSRHAEKRFNDTEREAVETLRVLRQVERIEQELKTEGREKDAVTALTASSGALAASPSNNATLLTKAAGETTAGKLTRIAPLLLLSALLATGCQPAEKTASGRTAHPAGDQVQVEIYLDWSLSTERKSFGDFVNSLVATLPTVLEELHAEHLTAFQFGSNGWAASEIAAIDLPTRPQAQGSEAAEIFGQVKNAQEEAATQTYRSQLQERLRGLTAATFTPPAQMPEPRCTDLQGVLRRVTSQGSQRRRLAIIATDGHDTCSRKIAPVSSEPETAIVIVLLPERLTTETGNLSVADYDLRRAEFNRAVPGAVIIPYFGKLAGTVREACAKWGNH